ncbi:hypothetical protein SAMN05421736_102193 [Evansella caseinilytica]|uniref:DUF4190 domain-containing protein n=1 Tax=Evansella caseinilytica TaxID=1503961 RepID=A0A1H3KM05_9BACI|nr:DUF4190 domain-containing protein [Evansella caseinilytica]SDY53181.1 hypothetical protein SAMN05421736_102193 [Evansella caseinilytica]
MPENNNHQYPRNFQVVDNHEQATDKKEEPAPLRDEEFREETAAEYTPNPGALGGRGTMEITSDKARDDIETEDETTGGRGLAAFAIALSIVSLLFLPIIFGAAGLVLGFMAVNRDQKALGYTAIVISAFSIIMSVFFAPFVT